MRIWIVMLALVLGGAAARAEGSSVPLRGNLVQGGLAYGQTVAGATVFHDGVEVLVTADGEFLLGFGRDHGPVAALEIRLPDGTVRAQRLDIAPRQFDIQRIDGLPQEMVTPDPTVLQRIRDDAARVRAARATRLADPLYRTGFAWPLSGVITGTYGNQRILNGAPRSPHWGIDIAAPAGTEVRAAADGVVTLADPDMYFSGQTLIIDHGYGLNTAYLHLSDILVETGQQVRRGQVVARVGASGRVTGAHLDWRMNVGSVRVDPGLAAGKMPASMSVEKH